MKREERKRLGEIKRMVKEKENRQASQQTKTKGFEITDRYLATGTPYPDPKTICEGQCEGMGVVPIPEDEREEPWRTLWLEAEKKKHTDNGTHFVKCPDCNGTGKRKEVKL